MVGEDTALMIHDFDTPVNVHSYNEALGATKCKTVSAVIAYDHPETGDVYMLVIHQAILIPGLKSNLLSPMQLRDYDIRVNDEPKHMVLRPTDDHHAIITPAVDGKESLRIPLMLKGVTSYFTSRKPTRQQYEQCDEMNRIELTNESIEWDPHTTRFEEQEAAMLDDRGRLRDPDDPQQRPRTVAMLYTLDDMDQPDEEFYEALKNTVQVKSVTAKDKRQVAMSTTKRGRMIGAKTLAKNWCIGLRQAEKTIGATTQFGLRTTLHPTLSRRFRTNDRQLRYRRLSHDMFTDTLKATHVSWYRRNQYAQVFCTRFGWTRVFPMQKKSDAHEGLSLLAQRDGIPPAIIMDGAKEQVMGEFNRKAKQMGIHVKQTEPYSPWQNAAEGVIREVKRGSGRKMVKAKSPAKLWDHCLELEGYIRSHTAIDNFELDGQVPETIVSGQTADISPFVEFPWYGWVKWWDIPAGYPDRKEIYGRWLGPSVDVGPAMCCKILKSNGQVQYSSSYRPLNEQELNDEREKAERDKFDKDIEEKLGKATTIEDLTSIDPDAITPEHELYSDDIEGTYEHIADIDDVTPEEADNYVGAEVTIQHGGRMQVGKVKRRARDDDGELTGTSNPNPILDTRTYEVEFDDGSSAEYSANIIAENMFAQCDPDGNQFRLMDEIVDFKSDSKAIKFADRFVTVNGRQYHRKSTAGWSLCISWKDGSTSWEKLSDLKESYPVEVAEFAKAQGIDHEPAFAWWVPYVLKKRDRIIAAVAKRFHKRQFKFGFEVPNTVQRARELDRENGNTLWQDAIELEMEAVMVAFKILNDGDAVPPGHQYMECHMIFDLKIEGFRRKARFVAGGHMTETPAVMTYATMVSRDTVRIALTIAALNGLEVKTSDIKNAFLQSPCEEKIYTILGPMFGDNEGKKAIIVRALYGLKSAGASFGRHISDCMKTLEYKRCKADSDLWYKPMVRPDDGERYYAYVLLFVDDCLAIGHDAASQLREIDRYFPMKPGSIGDPDIYLGAKLKSVQMENGVHAWGMSSSKYVQEAVSNAEAYLGANFGGRKLPTTKAKGPWPTDYVSELDTTPELSPKLATYYQSQIGVLHWIVELGRVDIITEVSLLASAMALPREGHLDAVFHVFGYLKRKHNARLVFDPTYPEIDHAKFPVHDWTHTYGEVREAIPIDMPEPLGKEVDIRLYVDADHAGDKVHRRSRTGFFIFLNSALIMWKSKKQATIETSVFGSEFVALKQGLETVRGLRYKLRMMGVPVNGPAYVYGDNMSVVNNSTRPESTLKKKSNEICYHYARESAAMDESRMGHIDTNDNPADIATKVIAGGHKRDHLVGKLLHDIAEEDD